MKKRNILIFVIVIMILTCMSVMAGCKNKDLTTEDLYNLVSYTTSSNESSRNVYIKVTSKDTVVYEYKNGNGSDPYNIGFNSVSFAGSGTGIILQADRVANESFVKAEDGTYSYFARITKPADALGVAAATNAKITVNVTTEGVLKDIAIEYDEVNSGTAYHVLITVTMAY